MTSSASGVRVDLIRAARAELEEGGHANLSLRAVTRRAGVSHAAPKHHFGDRAGLLTAVAADGFRELAAALDEVADVEDGTTLLARLGRRYVRFALDEPALYDLMFRAELTSDDPALQAARAASLGWLTAATNGAGRPGPPTDLTVVAWAFAHGVASLSREGLLPSIPLPGGDAASADLVGRFAALVTDAAAPPASAP